MNVAEVFIIDRKLPSPVVSYLCGFSVEPGDIVAVPFQKSTYRAIVIGIRDVREMKMLLRQGITDLRQVERVIHSDWYFHNLMHVIHSVSDQSILDPGTITKLISIKVLFDDRFFADDQDTLEVDHAHPKTLTSYFLERVELYVRKAKKQKILIVCPTQGYVDSLQSILKDQCDVPVLALHGLHTEKQKEKTLQKITTEDTSCLLITTPHFALPRYTPFDEVVIEHAGSPYYQAEREPTFDWLYFLRSFFTRHGIQVTIADSIPRFGFQKDTQIGQLQDKPIIVERKKQSVVDKAPITPLLLGGIKKAVGRGRVIVYANRKGVATGISCDDCGKLAQNEEGERYKIVKGDVGYALSDGKSKTDAFMMCQFCGSIKLRMIGYAVDGVADSLKEKIPEAKVFCVSADHTSTPPRVKKTLKEFYQSENAVLVTTQMGLPYLHEKVTLSVIPSLETLLVGGHSFSHWQKILHTLSWLDTWSEWPLSLQVADYHHPFLEKLKANELNQIAKEDLAMRKAFAFPPFGHAISLLISASHKQSDHHQRIVGNFLAVHELSEITNVVAYQKSARISYDFTLANDAYDQLAPELHALKDILRENIQIFHNLSPE